MINADFESILVPEDNGKQNPNESYGNKYQKPVACSCGYKLICVDDKFSKPFKWYLDKNAVYNIIRSMIEESKYCSDVMKKLFNKKLAMTKNNNSTKCWICDNNLLIMMLKQEIIVISLKDTEFVCIEIVILMLN